MTLRFLTMSNKDNKLIDKEKYIQLLKHYLGIFFVYTLYSIKETKGGYHICAR